MIILSQIYGFFQSIRRHMGYIVLGVFIILTFHLLFSARLCLSYVPEDLNFASGEKVAEERGNRKIQKMRKIIKTKREKQDLGEGGKKTTTEERKTKGEKSRGIITPPFSF